MTQAGSLRARPGRAAALQRRGALTPPATPRGLLFARAVLQATAACVCSAASSVPGEAPVMAHRTRNAVC